MRKQTITPLEDDDFELFGLILYFDTGVHSKLLDKHILTLESNKALFAASTKIIRLTGCKRFSEQDGNYQWNGSYGNRRKNSDKEDLSARSLDILLIGLCMTRVF
jgi:hypothetical protein